MNAEYSGSYTYSSDGFTFTKSTAENTAIDYTSDKEFTWSTVCDDIECESRDDDG